MAATYRSIAAAAAVVVVVVVMNGPSPLWAAAAAAVNDDLDDHGIAAHVSVGSSSMTSNVVTSRRGSTIRHGCKTRVLLGIRMVVV
jgi:hypothetical protein